MYGEKFKYKSANRKPDARSDVRVCGFGVTRRMHFSNFGCFTLSRPLLPTSLWKPHSHICQRHANANTKSESTMWTTEVLHR